MHNELKLYAVLDNLLQKGVGNIYKISLFLTDLLYQNKVIEEDNREACSYGIQITIANLINFVIAFSIGFLSKSVIEIAVFYCVFVSLRFFCGGYHAKSYGKCFSLFAVTCLSYLVMFDYCYVYTDELVTRCTNYILA